MKTIRPDVLAYGQALDKLGDIFISASNKIPKEVSPEKDKEELRKHLPSYKSAVSANEGVKAPSEVSELHGNLVELLNEWYSLTEKMSLEESTVLEIAGYIAKREEVTQNIGIVTGKIGDILVKL